jgi:hypothetical protein
LKYDIEKGEAQMNRQNNISISKQAKRATQIPQFLKF